MLHNAATSIPKMKTATTKDHVLKIIFMQCARNEHLKFPAVNTNSFQSKSHIILMELPITLLMNQL